MATTRTITARFAMGLSAVLLTSSPAQANLWLAHGGSGNGASPANGQIGIYTAPNSFAALATYPRVSGLAASDNVVYAYVPGGFDAQGRLVTLDPITGGELTSVLEPLNTDGDADPNPPVHLSIGDLAYDPITGTLYGAGNFGAGGSYDLFTIDPTDASRTAVGDLRPTLEPGNGIGMSIAFNDAGELFVLDSVSEAFLQVNPNDGSVISNTTLTLPAGAGNAGIGLGFDRDSGLFIASYFTGTAFGDLSGLMSIDPNNGFATADLGNFGDARSIHDIAFVIPEPTTAALLGLGGLALLRRRGNA